MKKMIELLIEATTNKAFQLHSSGTNILIVYDINRELNTYITVDETLHAPEFFKIVSYAFDVDIDVSFENIKLKIIKSY